MKPSAPSSFRAPGGAHAVKPGAAITWRITWAIAVGFWPFAAVTVRRATERAVWRRAAVRSPPGPFGLRDFCDDALRLEGPAAGLSGGLESGPAARVLGLRVCPGRGFAPALSGGLGSGAAPLVARTRRPAAAGMAGEVAHARRTSVTASAAVWSPAPSVLEHFQHQINARHRHDASTVAVSLGHSRSDW
jgi:hypothetical protein